LEVLSDEEADGPEERLDAAETHGPSRNSIVSWLVKAVVGTLSGADACFARVSSNYNFLNNGDDRTAIKEKKLRARETAASAL